MCSDRGICLIAQTRKHRTGRRSWAQLRSQALFVGRWKSLGTQMSCASFVSRARSPFLLEFLCSLAGFLLFSLPYSFIFPLLQQDEPFVFFFWFAQYFFQITAKFQCSCHASSDVAAKFPLSWRHISFVLVRSKTKENQISTQSRSLPAIVLLI